MPPKRKSSRAAESEAKRVKAEESFPPTKFKLTWDQAGEATSKGVQPLLFLDGPDVVHSESVAGFDIDWTIIRTKSGKKFGQGAEDWLFWNDKVAPKLKALHDAGTKIVFFTNQGGIEKGHTDVNTFCKKIGDIIDAAGVPIQVFASTGADHFRKPSTAMWKYMEEKCNGGVKVDPSKSLYVGDAAGRPKNWKPNTSKDFSCGDRKFAVNLGVQFYTPEEFFLGEKPYANFNWLTLNPKEFYEKIKDEKPPERLHSDTQEMVVMVGRPASGKSFITKHYFTPHGYVQVNRDTVGTQEKCLKMATSAFKEGKSVVVDNTNPTKAVRKSYIDLAGKNKVPVRCIYIDIPTEVSHHLNYVRQNHTKGKVRRIPEVAYRIYEKNFEKPEVSDGFAEVKSVGFIPHFDSEDDKEIFLQWTSNV